MQGIIEPAEAGAPSRASRLQQIGAWLWRSRVFVAVVLLPTLLVGAYYFLIASDQYESEAHFLVHSVDPSPTPTVGANSLISLATGASAGQDEAMSVADYLTSHDAVETLRRQSGLVQRFQRGSIDPISRLHGNDPTPERLLKYYRRQVKVEYNTETGITVLTVHAFTPQDAYDLSSKLLTLGEQRVNELNARSYHDGIAVAQDQLKQAEDALEANLTRMTRFRQSRADIDPQMSGQAQVNLVTTLTGQLSAARAQLNGMAGLISPNSPQYRALANRVQALSGQVAAQSRKLTGSNDTIAGTLGGYEDLKLRQDFLAKRYDAAASALQHAREQALRQQLYVVRVVNANMPVKSLFPQRLRIMATLVISLLLVYSISWLIAAGVREHAA